MELRVMRYFLAVAREENISRAAETLHISQPSLSRQLRELEEELDKTLFLRGRRKITLTEEGMYLRKRAEEMVALADKTAVEIASFGSAIRGDVSIGAGETEGMRLIAQTARALQTADQDIRLHIVSGDRVDILEQLERGLIDFVVLVGAADMSRYSHILLPHRDKWGVLMPKTHPLAEKKAVEPGDLLHEPLLISRQVADGSPILTWMGRSLSELNVVGTHNLIYNASLMVEEGLGLAVTLDGLINTTGDSPLCYRPLNPPLTVELRLVWKKYQLLSPAAEAFLERIRQEAAE